MARKHNVVIVGNGLFGSIAATLARAEGHKVTVIDANASWSASKASGCVLAPSWLSSLDRAQIDEAMLVLGGLYTLQDILFKTNLLKSFRAQRIDPGQILVDADVVGTATSIEDGCVVVDAKTRYKGKVLVAAGIACDKLVDMPAIRSLWGASILAKHRMKDPRIHVYAPYRQAVAFQIDQDYTWMGDGTALIEATWKKEERERIKKTVSRAGDLFGIRGLSSAQVNVGARPYVEGHKAGYFAQCGANTWVSTGGAKNGTVLAAYQASRFVTEALA